jgi:hypothetical protein
VVTPLGPSIPGRDPELLFRRGARGVVWEGNKGHEGINILTRLVTWNTVEDNQPDKEQGNLLGGVPHAEEMMQRIHKSESAQIRAIRVGPISGRVFPPLTTSRSRFKDDLFKETRRAHLWFSEEKKAQCGCRCRCIKSGGPGGGGFIFKTRPIGS